MPDQAGTQPDDKQPEPEQPATDPAENGVSDGAESTEGEQAESKTEFTVTWESEGETILTKTFAKGTSKDEVENAQPAEDPVKKADGDVAYEFAGWTPDYADVTADQTYTATFEEVEQDEMVNTASLVEPAADKGSRSVEVDGTITLSSGGDWSRNHKWSSENSTIATVSDQNSSQTTVTGVSAGETVIRHTYEQWEWEHMSYVSRTDTWEITVTAPVAATGVELKTQDGKTGEAEVTEFQTLKLVATPVPNNATGTYQWHSDNDEILSVQGNGNEATVTGKVRNQSANITVQFTPTAGQVQQATIKIDVKPDEAHSSTAKALVYYLINPRGDVNSNNDELFGDRYGEVTVNTTGMVWNHNNGRNCTTSDVKNRVVEWPDGYKVVEPQSSHWYAIFNSYKATVEEELGVTIEEKDVEEIRIIPAKISQNNGTDPDYHVDCNVQIVCKKVATVRYYLQDVGDTTPQFLGSKNYITGKETKPSDVTDKTFPETKDQGGVTYTFKGWYTDPFFTNGPVAMPQTVNGSTDYYAKYVAGRSVTYDLDGGSWNLGSQNNWTEQVDEGFLYTVKGDESTQLQRTGYTFAGWKVVEDSIDGNTKFNAGDKFTMPGRNVTLKAQWTPSTDTAYTVEHYQQKVADDGYTLVATDNKTGTTGEQTKAEAKSYPGFTAKKFDQVTIKADGSTVVKIYYDRNTYTVTYMVDGEQVGNVETYKFGAPVTIRDKFVKEGYTVTDWSQTEDFNMPANNVVITATSKINSYTVTYMVDGEQVGDVETYEFGAAVTVRDKFVKEGYTVTDWSQTEDFNMPANNVVITATSARNVTLVANSDEVVYDGNKHSVSDYVVKIGDVEVNDATFTGITVGAEGIAAKTYPVEFAENVKNTLSTDKKYIVTEVINGSLVITAQSINPTPDPEKPDEKDPAYGGVQIDSPSDSVYDGTEHKWVPTVLDKDGNALTDADYKVTYSTDNFTDVTGTITVTITGEGNYTGTVTRTYQITPASLKIITNSAEKTYDGSALTADGKIEGLVKGETATLKTTGSQTEVGESKNTYEIKWDGSAKEANYKIAEEDIGTLKVNARSGGGSSSKPTPEDEPTPTPTPTPLPTLPTTPAPTTPTRRVTRSTATVTEPASRPTEQITENETPKAESEPEVIEDEETPLAPMAGGAWALVNLILMLLTVLASLLLLLGYLGKKKYAKEDEYGNALHDANGNEIIDYTRNKKGFWRVASLIPAIAAVIAFALTENMRLPMVMTDRWTLLMVIIAVVQLIVAVLCKKKKESEEDENQANA